MIFGLCYEREYLYKKIPLPSGVRAFTVPDEQGDYNIYINSNLSFEQQCRSLEHETSHILRGDFMKDAAAVVIEAGRKLSGA